MPTLDLVIRGATVIDGSGSAPRETDLGIRGDRLVELGPNLSGASVLDARGLVAAPGFIDSHSHSDLALIATPILEQKIRQGVTLEVLGSAGVGVAPLHERAEPARRAALSGLLTDPDVPWGWRSVGEYLSVLRAARPAQDVAYLVPHGALREAILGSAARKATAEELQRMRALLAVGLEEGAYGFSTGLGYVPCSFSDSTELISLGLVAGVKQVAMVVSLRSEGARLIEAVRECGEIGRGGGVRVHIAGLKISGKDNWDRIGEVISALHEVRAMGVHLSADVYPYIAGSTMLSALLPPWAQAGGRDAAVARLATPEGRDRVRAALLDATDTSWDNYWQSAGPEGLFLSDLRSEKNRGLIGRSVAEAALGRGRPAADFLLELLVEESLGGTVLVFNQSEEVVDRLLQLPFVTVASDAILGGKPHPRTYGAFPRVLARFAREKETLTLVQAVRKMTGLPADVFGLRDHGYLEAGRRANVVLFDPASVDDLATFDAPAQFPAGIHHVLVGGKLVLRDGELTGQRPGVVVRRGG